MKEIVLDEMRKLADEYAKTESLRSIMDSAIEEKARERSGWSDITLNTHYLTGGCSPDIHRAAACTELLLLSLDIIDDLQDDDNRSKPWMTVPPKDALNAVMALLFPVFGELSAIAAKGKAGADLIGKVSRLLMRSVNAQQTDLDNAVATDQEYVAMVQEKSGSLMQLACAMGYLLAHADRQTTERIDEIAVCSGVMAQLSNDIGDIGRFDVKNDLLQRKKTLTTMFLLEHSDEDFPLFKRYYEGRVSQEEFLGSKLECLEFIENSGCVEYTRVILSLYFNRAKELYQALSGDDYCKSQFYEVMLAPFDLLADS